MILDRSILPQQERVCLYQKSHYRQFRMKNRRKKMVLEI